MAPPGAPGGNGNGFLWGVASSGFQMEGGPSADWARRDTDLAVRPAVTGHFDRFRQDILLLRDLGVNAYRFSPEWSRIQPDPGSWNESAADHYRALADALLEAGITPVLTLHHFTHPRWFHQDSPWHKPESVGVFLRYAESLVTRLRCVRHWITFNEPYVFLLGGWLEGRMPPGIRDLELAGRAIRNTLECHRQLHAMIHAEVPGAQVGVTHYMAVFAPRQRWNPLDRVVARAADTLVNRSLVEAFRTGVLRIALPFRPPFECEVPIRDTLDFFGLNYYTRIHLRWNPAMPHQAVVDSRDADGHGMSDLGWEVFPDGLARSAETAATLGVPIVVTENGIATSHPERKIRYIESHVNVLRRCIARGLDIRGYFYWSLMDNFEWFHGLRARFGLFSVDWETLERRKTPAAYAYARICRGHDGSSPGTNRSHIHS
jgi:beta-glucosidase